MNEDYRSKTLGPKLKAIRSAAGVTVTRVAEQLHVNKGLVSKWENGRAWPAYRRYVEHYADKLGGGEGLKALYDALAAGKARPDTFAGDVVIERREITRIFPATPADPLQVLDFRRIRALRDLESWDLSPETHESPTVDHEPTVVLFGPGKLELVSKEPVVGGEYPVVSIKHRIVFPETLKPGQRFSFAVFRSRKINFDEETREGFEGYRNVSPQYQINSLCIAVSFPGELRPKNVWHYAMDRDLAVSKGKQHLGQPLALDRFGFAQHEWGSDQDEGKSLSSQLAYGVAWTW